MSVLEGFHHEITFVCDECSGNRGPLQPLPLLSLCLGVIALVPSLHGSNGGGNLGDAIVPLAAIAVDVISAVRHLSARQFYGVFGTERSEVSLSASEKGRYRPSPPITRGRIKSREPVRHDSNDREFGASNIMTPLGPATTGRTTFNRPCSSIST